MKKAPERVTLIGSAAVSFEGLSLFQRVCLAVVLCACASFAAAQNKGLPPGPMQAKIKAACTQCHNASRITEQHLTRQQWSDQLDKMVGLGAEVSDDDRPGFLTYLTKNFGPEKAAKAPSKKSADQAK